MSAPDARSGNDFVARIERVDEALGFVADGPGFVEDGIAHTPMHLS